ncbi:MAG: hypothetical protein IJE66_05255, partial [Akkermansia sp.]|nr:hypothetical protein [Akkermansia sp.]
FFFPLFSLSGTPHGKVYHSFRNRCGPVVPRKVRALKTALPGRASPGELSPSTYSFEPPRNGVPQILHKTLLHVKLIFEKSFIFLPNPPRKYTARHWNAAELRRRKNFTYHDGKDRVDAYEMYRKPPQSASEAGKQHQ